MKKDFKQWLQEQCCYWYLLTQAEEEQWFTQWLEECQTERKEHGEHEEMV